MVATSPNRRASRGAVATQTARTTDTLKNSQLSPATEDIGGQRARDRGQQQHPQRRTARDNRTRGSQAGKEHRIRPPPAETVGERADSQAGQRRPRDQRRQHHTHLQVGVATGRQQRPGLLRSRGRLLPAYRARHHVGLAHHHAGLIEHRGRPEAWAGSWAQSPARCLRRRLPPRSG
jgi:hypothetical protein